MNSAYLPQHLNAGASNPESTLSLSPHITKEQAKIPVPRVQRKKLKERSKSSDGSAEPVRRKSDGTQSERASRTIGGPGSSSSSTRSSSRSHRTSGGAALPSLGGTSTERAKMKRLSRSKTLPNQPSDAVAARRPSFPANPDRSTRSTSPLRHSTGSSPTQRPSTAAKPPLRRVKSNADGMRKKKPSSSSSSKTKSSSVSPKARRTSGDAKKNHASMSTLDSTKRKEKLLNSSLKVSDLMDSSSSTDNNDTAPSTRRALRPSTQATRKIRHVRIADASANITHNYEGSDQDDSVFWYSKQDLKMLIDHELTTLMRSNGTKHSLHCCSRGVEKLLKGENKELKIAKYVLQVLKMQQDIRSKSKSIEGFSEEEAKELQAFSQELTYEDRKMARKFGMKDEAEIHKDKSGEESSNGSNTKTKTKKVFTLKGSRTVETTKVKPQMMSMSESVRFLVTDSLGESMRSMSDSMHGRRRAAQPLDKLLQGPTLSSGNDSILSLDAKPYAGRRERK